MGALVALIAVAFVWSKPDASGPLVPPDGASIPIPVEGTGAGTWGIPLPLNTSDLEVTLQDVTLLGATGIEIIGMGIHDPAVSGESILTAPGFPPPGIELGPIAGAVLPPRQEDGFSKEVLVGIGLAAGAPWGWVEAVKVTYVAGGRAYEVILPFTLRVGADAPDA